MAAQETPTCCGTDAGESRQQRRQRERQERRRPSRQSAAGSGSSQPTSKRQKQRPAPTASGADCPASSSGRSAELPVGAASAAAEAENPGQQLPVAAHPAVLARRGRHRSAEGNSSTTSMSEARPARAKMPSSRSWLSTVFSGRGSRAPPRTHRRRRCPCRRRSLRRTGPGRRRTPRRRKDRARWGRRRPAGTASLPSPIGSDGVTRGCRMRVPSHHAAAPRIEARAVERMRHLADQPLAPRRDRQARVGIQRDDIAHVLRQAGDSPSTARRSCRSAPRSRRFSSCSLPRLRSQPIHLPSPSFHMRRRCSRRKRRRRRRGP